MCISMPLASFCRYHQWGCQCASTGDVINSSSNTRHVLKAIHAQGCLMKYLVATTMNHNACVSIETPIFYFITHPKQFFLFLIWCNLLHRISYFGCSEHHVQFSLMLPVVTIILVCFTLVVPSPSILPGTWYRYSVCHPKNRQFLCRKIRCASYCP
jgi:hypothetical protein